MSASYRVALDPERAVLAVDGWFKLRLLTALNTVDGPDETLGVRVADGVVTSDSTRWASKRSTVDLYPDRIELRTTVRGTGRLSTVDLLGGARPPGGFLPSGSALREVLSPNPDHPRRIVRPAVESATIGVTGDGAEPGVGRWLFTPAPWCYAVSRGDGEWAAVGLLAPIEEQNFTAYHYVAGTDGFSLRLDYEGHTVVDGEFHTPTLVIVFGQPDPYAALARYRELLPAPPAREPDPAWRQPMFCGWGAQCHLAAVTGRPARDFATQERYDDWLAGLDRHGVVPGTVVVDDKWQAAYATGRPDPRKWPDLAGWIAGRHARGQRVLLWHKAWDPEGAPAEACVRLPDGTPVALDPQSPAGAELIEESVRYALDTLGADGFKVDFTGRTPSGTALRHAGDAWGARLLHELLARLYRTAKAVRPDALVVTHTPNAAFADVTDMVRLNDIRMFDAPDPDGPVVAHMSYRAAVVRAAVPDLPVDTDGWCLPDLATFREYVARQPELGVPALYYATHLDLTGEPLSGGDLAAVAETWHRYRATQGLPSPTLRDCERAQHPT